MANETELSNIAHQTDVISDGISAALLQDIVVVPQIRSEDLPSGTATKLFRKNGSLVAQSLAESSTYSYSANSELTQTTVSVTATKIVVVSKFSVEAQTFSGLDIAGIIAEQGPALARLLDDNVLALFSGFTSNTAPDTGSALTVEGLMEGAYRVAAAGARRVGRNLTAIVEHKGAFEIKKQLVQSGASVFAQPEMATLVRGVEQPNGYQGSLPGMDVFSTDGIPVTSSNDDNLVFNPDIAFAAMYGPVVTMAPIWDPTLFAWIISSYVFSGVAEWNDAAACRVNADS